MPGLVIIVTPNEKNATDATLNLMVASMRHESFYHSGTYSNADLGVYVGWVTHAGSYCDCMPLSSKDGNFLLFFYGEHQSEEGATAPNAHAVLSLFEQHGLGALPLLNGWFQGAVVDLVRREVAVFVDRFGMQRLHYCERNGTTMFASEAKALLAVRPDLRQLDPRGLGELLSCGCVLENRSLFSGVLTVPAATIKIFYNGALTRNYSYFRADEWESQEALSPQDYQAQLLENFPRAVRRCMATDQSLAISLTGGFDTRMIMAWIPPEQLRRIPCYTFGGMYRECFDVQIARKVAQLADCHYQVLELGDHFLRNFPALAEKTILLSHGGLGATNAYELYLNQAARQIGVVRLTGSFGSEVLRGARAFKAVSLPTGLLHNDVQEHVREAIKTFAEHSTRHPVSFSVFEQAPRYYYNRLVVEQSQVAVRTPYMDNDFVGLVYRRPTTLTDGRKLARYIISRGSMKLAALRTDTGNCSYPRHVWSQFLFKADYCYKSGMPDWLEKLHHLSGPLSPERFLIGRHRFAHFRVWFRNQLAPYLREILLDRRTFGRAFFDRRALETMLTRHIKGDRNHTDDIERALTLELTCRQFIDN
jgi:asparagine synthase (glutamine-hydrolysing)